MDQKPRKGLFEILKIFFENAVKLLVTGLTRHIDIDIIFVKIF